jgi:hypothetical protein
VPKEKEKRSTWHATIEEGHNKSQQEAEHPCYGKSEERDAVGQGQAAENKPGESQA